MARDFALYDTIDASAPATARSAPSVPAAPSLWARIVKAVATSRQRKAENAVERYIRSNGGRLTDNMERDISRKFGRMAGDGL